MQEEHKSEQDRLFFKCTHTHSVHGDYILEFVGMYETTTCASLNPSQFLLQCYLHSRCSIDICWVNDYTSVEIKSPEVVRVGFMEEVASYLDYYGALARMSVIVNF